MFKKDDKVECVNVGVLDGSEPSNLTLGKTYVVAADQSSDTNVTVVSDRGHGQGYYPARFKLAEATLALDLTKPVETQDGRAVTIVLTDARGDQPVRGYIGDSDDMLSWTAEGKYFTSRADYRDLRNVPPKPLEKEVYINVYKNVEGKIYASTAHDSRAVADDKALSHRVGCIKTKLVEGQFDE